MDAIVVRSGLGTAALVHLAIVHGAVYDAVNAIDGGYEPYLGSPPAEHWYSKEAAAATAAHDVLVGLFPAQKAILDEQLAASLTPIPDGPAKEGGEGVGAAAATAMLLARQDDGRFGEFRFPVPDDPLPGQWRPVLPAFVNDPNAWIKDVKPFLIDAGDQFRTDGPHALASAAYSEEFEEVRMLGSAASTKRTADQTDQARFWADNAFAMWGRIFRQLSATNELSIDDNARLYGMLYLTAADAQIATWNEKARWSFWRPITAIREADTDGNPATQAESNWLPLIATPPYPDHTSGHCGVSGAFVGTLQDFFGTDKIEFSATSAVSGTTRAFTRFSQAIKEIIDARVYAGLHFRTADVQGAGLAKKVAQWRDRHFFGAAH